MLTFITDNATRQMIGDVSFIRSVNGSTVEECIEEDFRGFVTIRFPVLIGEVTKGGQSDIVMQPIFQTIPIPELKVRVSSYFIIEFKSEIKTMYERIIEIHKANLAGIVIPGNPAMFSGGTIPKLTSV